MEWLDSHTFQIRGETFKCGLVNPATDVPVVRKEPEHIRAYVALIAELAPKRIVEVGAYDGASGLFLNALARPDVHVAVDLLDTAPWLEGSPVVFLGGLDQADPALGAKVGEVIGHADLVIDDASHEYWPTMQTFNQLQPLSDVYLIEDWIINPLLAAQVADHLSRRVDWSAEVDAKVKAWVTDWCAYATTGAPLQPEITDGTAEHGEMALPVALYLLEHWDLLEAPASTVRPFTDVLVELFIRGHQPELTEHWIRV